MRQRIGWIALILLVTASEARAQFAPPYPVPVLIPNGVGFSFRSGSLRVGGFFGNGAYTPGYWWPPGVNPALLPPIPAVPYYLPLSSSIDYRVNYQFITPRIVMAPGPYPPLTPQYDLSGVDLDAMPINKVNAQPERFARDDPPAKNPAKVMAPRPEPKPAVKPEPRPVEVAKVAKPDAAAEKVAKLAPAPERQLPRFEPPPPKAAPLEETDRLLQLGQAAFGQGEFGIAAKRFSQARELDPKGQSFVYLAQAQFALGKYQDAVRTIEEGMKRSPDWARSAFRPRTDLYKDRPEDWQRHRELLEAMVKRHPNEPAYLILLAHQLWFDDSRLESLILFRRANQLAPNSAIVDAFLQAAGERVVRK